MNAGERVVGVDAAGSFGWVGVVLDSGAFAGTCVGTLRAIVAWAEPVAVAGVDIPIGHVDGGVRRRDVEARAFVGPRRSSVFAAPPAEVLTAASYAEGNAALTSFGMPKLSRQA
jgi:predicted RNase H-like nuclease